MDAKVKIKGLYLVTDTAVQNRFSHEELAGLVLKEGVRIIQLREKRMGAASLLRSAKRLAELCRRSGAISIINDRVDIALAAGADGVHLGREDLPVDVARRLLGPEKVIGGTASGIEEARQVERLGADYVGFGHIFETTTKHKDYPPKGVHALAELKAAVSIPVVAIGGIHAGNIREVFDAGAEAAALSSAVCAAEEPEQAVRTLMEQI